MLDRAAEAEIETLVSVLREAIILSMIDWMFRLVVVVEITTTTWLSLRR
jgi:hypothetical protein